MNCYFCEHIPEPPGRAVLDGSESRHAAASRRQRAGDRVVLVDGRGTRAVAAIVSITRSSTALTVERRDRVAALRPAVVLASALPKGDRLNTMLDMVTQLGIDRWVPLRCERSVVKASASGADRWFRVCVQACKQSHNPWLPKLDEPADPVSFVRRLVRGGAAVWAADPGGETLAPGPEREVALCIGPEGGFSEGEKAEMTGAGARFFRLSGNVLRIETAAVAAVCAVRRREAD